MICSVNSKTLSDFSSEVTMARKYDMASESVGPQARMNTASVNIMSRSCSVRLGRWWVRRKDNAYILLST